MPEFRTPVDIANRALQILGQPSLDPVRGLSDGSARASEVSLAYGKLREAELERNTWEFSIKLAVLRAIVPGTMVLQPALYMPTTTYFRGSIVIDQFNNAWISSTPNNLGNDPLTSTTWEPYFGPLTVSLYSSGTAYYSGEIVYTMPGDGTSRVYFSVSDGNSDNPATATAWDATATYSKSQVVTRLTIPYMSLIDLNLNQDPSTTTVAAWSAATTYSTAQKATGSDGAVYASTGNGNLNNNPITDGGVNWTNTGVLSPWTAVFVGGSGSLKWLQIGGAEFPAGVTLATPNIVYPLAQGPSLQAASRNIFRLPAGFMRRAPRDPKAGSFSWLGVPSNMLYEDWVLRGDYITSRDPGPLVIPFVANVVDVTKMRAMFCEGLAARIAVATCERITQSTAKVELAEKGYDKAMGEARLVDAILVGSEEPPLDDWIAARL